MHKTILLLLLLTFASVFTSCEKESTTLNTPTSFSEIFEAYWNSMNTNYVYWDIDTTDWDEIYYKYQPAFAKLDITNQTDAITSVEYFRELTQGLIDSHYHISFTNTLISGYFINPSVTRKQKLPGFHYPYSYYQLVLEYLDKTDNSFGQYKTEQLTVLSGIIDNKILYFGCSKFKLYSLYSSASENDVKTTLQYFFNKLANLNETVKGIIIDVRGNSGGDLEDLNFFVGHFINTPLHFGFTQAKSGNGRLDFTPWVKAVINPENGGTDITIPIIVLADNLSASLSELLVMAFKAKYNCTVIGENTAGATGPLTQTKVYNDGQFDIENYMHVQTSSCKFKHLDGIIYENIGFPPDIYVPYNPNAINRRKDSQLEKAISLIK